MSWMSTAPSIHTTLRTSSNPASAKRAPTPGMGLIAQFHVFRPLDTDPDRHQVAHILGKQGCFEHHRADLNGHLDHPPPVGHPVGNGLNVLTLLLLRDGDMPIWRRPGSVNDLTVELDVHGQIITWSGFISIANYLAPNDEADPPIRVGSVLSRMFAKVRG